MKTLLTIVISIASITGLFAQDFTDISTKIKSVTLFPDRAQIYHEGSVDIPGGKTVLKIKGLSPMMVQETMQVEGRGDFMIMAVNQKLNYLENTEESEEIKSLRKKVKELQVKIEDENTAIAILKEKEAFLAANKIITGGNNSISSSEFKILTEQYVSGIESVRLGILSRTRKVKVMQEEKNRLENQIAGKLGSNSLPTSEVYITVMASKGTRANISLNYLVINAGWYPSYDIRVNSTNEPVNIFYKANVFQNTGIDWKDVRLSFSSASPSVSGIMPVLHPWYLNFQQTGIRIRGMASGLSPKASRLKTEEMEMMDLDEAVAVAPPVSISLNGTNFSFDLDINQNIPSTGEVSLIELQRLEADAVYRYMSIPKLRKEAFLTAGIVNWESLNLLDGEANIYFGNTFTGETYISRAQLGDTLSVSLGRDENISIERKKRTDFTSTRMIGTNRVDTRSFTISVRNNRANSIQLILNDQIPISQNNQISIEAEELSEAILNETTGMLKWSLDLKPNESRELVLTYKVKYPKNQKVILE